MSRGRYQLFVDLDGVLVDFEAGVQGVTGKHPDELQPSRMWSVLARTPDFYSGLEWMADGRFLWERVREMEPVILTGIPPGKWAEPQKRSWCRQHLGGEVPVITCVTRKKAERALEWMEQNLSESRIPVLIDDRIRIAESWRALGGRFILHVSAEQSLQELQDFGY